MLVVVSVLGAWQAGHWALGEAALVSPGTALMRLAVLGGRAGFWMEAADTGWAFLVSAVISVVGGAALGCVLGLSRVLGRVVEPVLGAFYALPKVTLYPVVLLLFGLGGAAKVAFGVMHGLIPIGLVTMAAVLEVQPVLLRTGRAMRLGLGQMAMRIMLPAVLPEVLGGVRIGVPLALLGVLIGEMFASRRGLGSMAMRAMEGGDGATLLAVAVLLSGVALGVNWGLGRVARGFAGSVTGAGSGGR